MWRYVDPGLTDVSEERIASIFGLEISACGGPSVSGWLQTEPPIGNNQLYKNREGV
jgi:hypothetical protein